ncbi:class I SAM-dependent methyltransferase [Dictyobacter kobayashii]|uniref:Methyltransferase domain-containing protein n=1 Tax=Dictyobacter kobayashii TaxID=2014872 RepID=A0A402AI03_9CHLR|nr:class I SAM-dependent methyltransferase [Dictyobacter kobayashii]GCE18751.1 hypothetical protein KDK_25510 [Dictyobacter kobayashii]
MSEYKQVIATLRQSYNREKAEQRNREAKSPWKITERQHFLELLQQEKKVSLLEIGAGTGVDSLFFREHGLRVVSTDLSPDMVDLCREKGLDAHVMDFLNLDFPAHSFDAIYALNCLLHVPTSDLPLVFQKLRDLLRPGGLFFLGVYGGFEEEGIYEDDQHQPPRFFSHHTDDFMRQATAPYFDLVSFKAIPVRPQYWHFQSIILRARV